MSAGRILLPIPARRPWTSDAKQRTGERAARGFFRCRGDEVSAANPKPLKAKLLALRRLISTRQRPQPASAALQETLKWGQPSLSHDRDESGSTIRIDRVKSCRPYAVYFHCQTDLVETFRQLYPTQLRYGGNRSILLNAAETPRTGLRRCVALARTYHLRKRKTVNRSP